VLVITLIFRYSGHVEFVLGRRCVSYILSLYTVCTDSIVIPFATHRYGDVITVLKICMLMSVSVNVY